MRVRRDQVVLGLANIGAAFEQRRWKSGGQFGRCSDLLQSLAARDFGGRICEQQVQCIFGLRDGPLHARNRCGRGVQELLGLLHFQAVGRAAILALSDQPQVVAPDVIVVLGDFKLQIQLPHLKIGGHDIGDQRNDDAVPRFFRCQVLGARGFVQAAQPAPQIELPRKLQARLGVAGRKIGAGRDERERADRGTARGAEGTLRIQSRKQVGARDSVLGASLQNAFSRDPHVEVFLERRFHQLL